MNQPRNLANQLDEAIANFSVYDDTLIVAQERAGLDPLERWNDSIDDKTLHRLSNRIEELLRHPDAGEAVKHIVHESREFLTGFLKGEEEFAQILESMSKEAKS